MRRKYGTPESQTVKTQDGETSQPRFSKKRKQKPAQLWAMQRTTNAVQVRVLRSPNLLPNWSHKKAYKILSLPGLLATPLGPKSRRRLSVKLPRTDRSFDFRRPVEERAEQSLGFSSSQDAEKKESRHCKERIRSTSARDMLLLGFQVSGFIFIQSWGSGFIFSLEFGVFRCQS